MSCKFLSVMLLINQSYEIKDTIDEPTCTAILLWIKNIIYSPRKHNSVGRDMHYYMHGLGFEPRTSHLITLKKVNFNQ